MGSEIVYCAVCGDRILEREFEKGRAITILKMNYCSRCMINVVKETSPTPIAPRRPRTQKTPKADPPSRFKITLPFLFAIGVGIVALVLLVIVLTRGSD